MERTRTKLGGALMLLVLLLGSAGTGWANTATPPPEGQRIYDMQWLNINKWLCPFYNDGRYALDITVGSGEAGGSWPQPFKNKYIFGAGLWFGSLKPRDDDPTRVDTLVSFGYNPNSGGTEMTPTSVAYAPQGAGATEDRIYVFPGTWPPPVSRFEVDAWRLGANRRDTIDPELIPTENFSLQDMWCVYSDAAPENHIAPGFPQNIEVYQTVYAWNYPSNEDIFFIIYKVRNAGELPLRRCYMGALMDPDIGVHDDDMVGLLLNDPVAMPTGDTIIVQNVGFAGDYNNVEVANARLQWEEGTPGVVAYKFLESPKMDSSTATGDTLVAMGMTAFKKFNIDVDPVTDPTQYLTMAGYDYRTGVLSPYDSIDESEADKRFIQCSGPFDLAPGQVEVLIVACIAAPHGGEGQLWAERRMEYNDSLWHLASVANAAQFIYDQGWLLPGPPSSPNITLVPGDNSVRIVWDNLPETEPDAYWKRVASNPESPGYDPAYLGYDFQGYMVYKSADGSEWDLIAQCDIADDIPGDSTWYYPPGGDSSLPDSMWIEMSNSGLFYSVLDDDVTNGYEYYYCVTAYDWNYITTGGEPGDTLDTLILRSGIVSNFSTVPRWEPANYVDPVVDMVTMRGDTLRDGLRWYPFPVVPFRVLADTYEIQFLGPEYVSNSRSGYRYYIRNLAHGSLAKPDTVGFDYAVGDTIGFSLGVYNGVEMACTLNIGSPTRAYDSVAVLTGEYPVDRLNVPDAMTQQALWAFRGSDFKVVWQEADGYKTAKVLDMTKGEIELPFRPFATSGQGPRQADGWCFLDKTIRNPTDTLKPGVTARMYVCGGMIALNYVTQGADTISHELYDDIRQDNEWMLYGRKVQGTAPFYNTYQMVSTPGFEKTDSTYEYVVRVVPNPYIVFNPWETTTTERVIKFTNLPGKCVIRVFTLSGDLVKVIRHRSVGEQPLELGGTATWDLLNDNQQLIASGVYVYHVESDIGEYTGKFAFVH